ncbi:MAG: DUF2135 domain-containing protein [Myxococcales bacterium]|nr:DUF2135 domain-containing protein [Myxococcales bacterium]
MSMPLPLPPPRLVVPVQPKELPVELVAVAVRAEVSGALVVTTWELTFKNPNARVLEGQLEFPLLAGQTVIRFAMDLEGSLREAVPVAKDKGRQVFEEVVRKGIDPGLLEKTAGNSYKARVYPLLPGAHKRVVIAYQEEIDDGVYRLALDFGRLENFTLELSARGSAALPAILGNSLGLVLPAWRQDLVTRATQQDFTARGVLELALPPSERPAVTTQVFEDRTYFRAEQTLELRSRARQTPRVVGLVWDCSGSAAERDTRREHAALAAYFKAVGAVEVRLVRLRDAVEPTEVFQLDGSGEWSAVRRAIDQTFEDGATALGAWRPEAGVDAWILCSDGLGNFGPDALPDTGPAPLHVLAAARRSDPARLQALADRSGGEFVDLLKIDAEAAAERLTHERERITAIETSPKEVAQVYPEAPAPLRAAKLVIAGVLRAEQATVRVWIGFAGETARPIDVAVRAGLAGTLAARAWAALKIAALEPLYARNEADIERTGQTFGIVTRGTSLIILDAVEDYARHDITPPPELRAAWEQARRRVWHGHERDRQARVERVVGLFREYVAWWERDFSAKPEDKPDLKKKMSRRGEEETRSGGYSGAMADFMELERERSERAPPPPPSSPAPMRPAPMQPSPEPEALYSPSTLASPRDEGEAYEDHEAPAEASSPAMARLAEPDAVDGAAAPARAKAATIQLQKWSPDAGYLDRLRRTDDARLYHVYLEERPDHLRSTAFFLDAADVFFERGQPALALRVLSNLAEMELENPAVLRILGYRLLQAGRPDLAVPVFTQVRKLRPEEPQSHRDLAQACAAAGDLQAAVDLLWEVAVGGWDARFPEIELIALVELNAIAASGPPLDLAKVDPRARRALPLDLRVVLTWDADDTDIDLWVTDPDGEKAYFGNRLTRQGGRMSPDFRQGYGPEEFSLRRARPGEYLVEANFYGNTQQIIAGATTIQLQLTTGFATANAQHQRVTLRLRETREVVTVGRFTVA